ncbi:MAG: C4-dicarboxylate transporter, partial [Thermoplasmata archaeon]
MEERIDKKMRYSWIKNFGPQWFSAVMGTGALSISMNIASDYYSPFSYISQFFLLFSIIMFLVFIVPWTSRFITNYNDVKKDLFHPVLGNFFPTMPISLVIIGIALDRVGPSIIDISVVNTISLYLFIIGSIGIFIFGWMILSIIFTHKKIKLEHANYGWFIPPVSHLIIPVLGFSLMKHYTDALVDNILFFISMIGFSVGLLLFIFVGSIVYHRYIFHELPPSHLAPTFLIGIAPTSIITIILVKILGALSGFSILGIDSSSISAEIKLLSVMTWGFSLWWFAFFL